MRILLDCDGILADFATAFLRLTKKATEEVYTEEQLKTDEFLEVLDSNQDKSTVEKLMRREGYCFGIPPYDKAKEAFETLKTYGEIYIVTSPMKRAPFWTHERTLWLLEHFNINRRNIIFAMDKFIVSGDIFVDDNINNVVKWENHNSNGKSLLWDRPWNKANRPKNIKIVYDWENVISVAKEIREIKNGY